MSSTELTTSVEIVQPLTGELIPVGDIKKVGEALRDLRDYKAKVDATIALFTEAAIEASKRLGTRTLTGDGYRIEVSADTELDWDILELQRLLDAGLPPERYAQLVAETVSYKVNAAVAKQIEAANDEYGAIVKRARLRVAKRQYVSVKSVTPA